MDLDKRSRQVLPDAGPCNNEIFIDLAFEGTLRAFGEAPDVVLDVKRLGGRVMLIYIYIIYIYMYMYIYILYIFFVCLFVSLAGLHVFLVHDVSSKLVVLFFSRSGNSWPFRCRGC